MCRLLPPIAPFIKNVTHSGINWIEHWTLNDGPYAIKCIIYYSTCGSSSFFSSFIVRSVRSTNWVNIVLQFVSPPWPFVKNLIFYTYLYIEWKTIYFHSFSHNQFSHPSKKAGMALNSNFPIIRICFNVFMCSFFFSIICVHNN